MHSSDLTEANIDKLVELFPNCVTEAQDEDGKLKPAIDFDQFKQELSDHPVNGVLTRPAPARHGTARHGTADSRIYQQSTQCVHPAWIAAG